MSNISDDIKTLGKIEDLSIHYDDTRYIDGDKECVYDNIKYYFEDVLYDNLEFKVNMYDNDLKNIFTTLNIANGIKNIDDLFLGTNLDDTLNNQDIEKIYIGNGHQNLYYLADTDIIFNNTKNKNTELNYDDLKIYYGQSKKIGSYSKLQYIDYNNTITLKYKYSAKTFYLYLIIPDELIIDTIYCKKQDITNLFTDVDSDNNERVLFIQNRDLFDISGSNIVYLDIAFSNKTTLTNDDLYTKLSFVNNTKSSILNKRNNLYIYNSYLNLDSNNCVNLNNLSIPQKPNDVSILQFKNNKWEFVSLSNVLGTEITSPAGEDLELVGDDILINGYSLIFDDKRPVDYNVGGIHINDVVYGMPCSEILRLMLYGDYSDDFNMTYDFYDLDTGDDFEVDGNGNLWIDTGVANKDDYKSENDINTLDDTNNYLDTYNPDDNNRPNVAMRFSINGIRNIKRIVFKRFFENFVDFGDIATSNNVFKTVLHPILPKIVTSTSTFQKFVYSIIVYKRDGSITERNITININ